MVASEDDFDKDFKDLVSGQGGNKAALEMLRKELSSLKKAVSRLTKRVNDLENLGIQDQLNALDKNLRGLGPIILRTRQEIAQESIKQETLWMRI